MWDVSLHAAREDHYGDLGWYVVIRFFLAALVLSACASSVVTNDAQAPQPDANSGGLVVLANQGPGFGGHTPRGFTGSGTGLFTGDNLNGNFPDGEIVQLFVSFDATGVAGPSDSVILRSDALHVSGTPFEDLGALLVEPISYNEFGPHLFDRVADGPAVVCERVDESSIACDVTAATNASLATGVSRLQFRLAFERPGDLDGSQDLAMFYLSDSNTNDPGIFTLELE